MRKIVQLGIVALPLVALSGPARAGTIAFGTFSFSNFGTGDVTFTNTPAGNTLGAATRQIVLPGQIITSLTPTYLGNPNSFCSAVDCGGINGPDPTGRLAVSQSLLFLGGTNSINIAPGGHASAIDFQFSSGTTPANRYEFHSTPTDNVLIIPPSFFGPSSFIMISYAGSFSDASGFFDSEPAFVSFIFTQASAGATVGESGSFATSAPVPEPSSMALTGSGLVLIRLIARKRNKARHGRTALDQPRSASSLRRS